MNPLPVVSGASRSLSEATRQERTQAGIAAWHAWMETHKAAVTVAGGPLGTTLRVSTDGISGAKNNLCGYVVVMAESHQAAASLFVDHPHFAIFPGEGVEVLECLPVPGA